MEYIVCCLCSLLCFVCGVWADAAQNCRVGNEKSRNDAAARTAVDDALSRDIAALLAYTGPAEKERTDADS